MGMKRKTSIVGTSSKLRSFQYDGYRWWFSVNITHHGSRLDFFSILCPWLSAVCHRLSIKIGNSEQLYNQCNGVYGLWSPNALYPVLEEKKWSRGGLEWDNIEENVIFEARSVPHQSSSVLSCL